MLKGEEGFTIIELTIFLAISGLLLLVMFTGTGMIASRQRFSDTTDNLQAFFQAQYEEVVNGVNVRDSSTSCTTDGPTATLPGKSKCLLLGKLLTVSASGSTIQAAYIISTQSVTTQTTDKTKLQAASLQVMTNGQKTYELKWGAAVSKATRSTTPPLGSGRGAVNSVAFLRIPDDSRIIQLYYNDATGNPGGGLVAALADDNAYNPPANSTGPSLAVCIKNDTDFTAIQPRSAIMFSQGQGAGNITTNYNPGSICT